jgi:PD-(D/E)XK nuclease superfamily
MTGSKDAKGTKGTQTGSKDTKGTKGTKVGGVGSTPRHGLSIPSPRPDDLEELVFRVIGTAMKVHTRLGPGLPEAFYRDALVVELESVGLSCETERAASTTITGASCGAIASIWWLKDAWSWSARQSRTSRLCIQAN